MKNKTTLVLILFIPTFLIWSGCQYGSDLEESSLATDCTSVNKSVTERFSVTEAEALVRDMMFCKIPDMNPLAQFPLEEITTDEIWRRLHVQVFRLHCDSSPETYAISDEKIDTLGCSFGGHGVTHMHVTDLDSDGNPELTYTFSCGSGLHRSHIAVYIPNQTAPNIILANLVYYHGDLALEKHNDQKVIVKAGRYDPWQGKFATEATMGQVFLKSQGSQLELVVDLPPEIRKKLSSP